MKKLDELRNKLGKCKNEIISRFHVKEIGIFGSYIRRSERAPNDIDILVVFKESPSMFGFLELEDYLSKLLGIKVDLVMKDALKPNIGKHILQEVVYL